MNADKKPGARPILASPAPKVLTLSAFICVHLRLHISSRPWGLVCGAMGSRQYRPGLIRTELAATPDPLDGDQQNAEPWNCRGKSPMPVPARVERCHDGQSIERRQTWLLSSITRL